MGEQGDRWGRRLLPGAWQRPAASVLFVMTECVAWYIVLRAVAGATLRAGVEPLAIELETGLSAGAYAGREAEAEQALRVLQDALANTPGGPSLPVVVLTGLAAFALARWLARMALPGGFGVLVGLLVSVVALQVLIRIALAGDLLVWDASGLERFLDVPEQHFAANIDAAGFIEEPTLRRVAGSPSIVTVAGLVALWCRFAAAGRRDVQFERVLRSAGLGFAAALLGAVIAGFGGVHGVASYLLLYFVLSVLALSVAHAVRALGNEAGGTAGGWRRDAPWAVSVAVTLGGVALVAAVFALLAAFDAGRVAGPPAELAGRVLVWLLELMLTPVFWLVNTVLGWIIGDASLDVFERASQAMEESDDPPTGARDPLIRLPGWASDVATAALIAGVLWLGYRLGRRLFGRSSRLGGAGYAETRAAAGDGGDGLLRRIMPRRRGGAAASNEWLRRHAVYGLYGRLVVAAAERGVTRRPGDTPIEFGRIATARLASAPQPASPARDAPFNEIAAVFDRARYGRHFPPPAELRPLEQALAAWEQAHPPGAAGEEPGDSHGRLADSVEES